ncbi:putative transcriptional regulator, lacI family protein [Oceanicola granulosus HTCC2516]|uniref:Putative transcriptional regulator, lacI family protein n=1 Tax=Oceanicola granulosus (strain ATCC BAA-861 / DSM 15982 / KCTC 12143 / HTCC2516) TaxID=314256 RepID=Q2CGD0_OCEGH|nr:LacI family DNA-binding transcriptional regulator [Oceanicola granulosus]EAR51788.1 putative transcriptional regulator, lacI family protein [Oceanicola granulosus HTCC2516]
MSDTTTARPTLKTICARTGLSVATVSKALRGSDAVRPETRALVEEAAREVGYRLNRSGLALRTGKTYQIAAVMTAPRPEEDEWEGVEYAQLLSGISLALEGSPYRVMLYAVDDHAEATQVIRQLVDGGEADGVILSGTRPRDERVALLQARDVPFVTLGTTEHHAPHAFVDTDNAAIMEVALRRLAGRGHERIALINPPAEMSYARTREAVYRRMLDELGLAVDEALILSGTLNPAFGRAAVARLSALSAPPTAYICANEAAALGALSGFAEHGLVHGRDAVINATDDLNVSAYFVPPLTTFFLPISRPARLLGEYMLARLAGEPVEKLQTLLMPELIERSDDILTKEARP